MHPDEARQRYCRASTSSKWQPKHERSSRGRGRERESGMKDGTDGCNSDMASMDDMMTCQVPRHLIELVGKSIPTESHQTLRQQHLKPRS